MSDQENVIAEGFGAEAEAEADNYWHDEFEKCHAELEKAKAEAERLRRPLKRLRARVIQMGIETATLKRQRDELRVHLSSADYDICNLCKRVNPHHAECTSCQEHDDRLDSLGSGE